MYLLLMRQDIAHTGEAVTPFVAGDLITNGVELLVAQLEGGGIDPFIRGVDKERHSPVPGKLYGAQPFQGLEGLLYIFISQVRSKLQPFCLVAKGLYVFELEPGGITVVILFIDGGE